MLTEEQHALVKNIKYIPEMHSMLETIHRTCLPSSTKMMCSEMCHRCNVYEQLTTLLAQLEEE